MIKIIATNSSTLSNKECELQSSHQLDMPTPINPSMNPAWMFCVHVGVKSFKNNHRCLSKAKTKKPFTCFIEGLAFQLELAESMADLAASCLFWTEAWPALSSIPMSHRRGFVWMLSTPSTFNSVLTGWKGYFIIFTYCPVCRK